MSVLDYQDLTACANKTRKPGYWKLETIFVGEIPEHRHRWIADRSSTDCKYDRKAIDPACAAANCTRIK